MSDVRDARESADDELNQCLDLVKMWCGPRPLADGVRHAVFNLSIGVFQKNAPDWPAAKDQVLEAAEFVGRIAALCADLDHNPSEVTEAHVKAAIAAVRQICHARSHIRLKWCPDV